MRRFYQVGEETLAQGLSAGARTTLGLVVGLLGVGVALVAHASPKPHAAWVFAGFCFAIGLACLLRGAVRKVFGRVVATAVFAACVWYLAASIRDGVWVSRPSEPSIVNACLLMLFAGVPAATYARWGRFRQPQHVAPHREPHFMDEHA